MRIAVLGYGKEGRAAQQYFAARGDAVQVFTEVDTPILDKTDFSCYNLVLRSPSVPPRDGFSSITQYFFAHCPAPIIGVTGTKGKGTTCSMITELLRALGRKVFLVGNIGVPAIAQLDAITADDVVVYELSSFQLWDLKQSPHVAVVLRIAPDHLNVHKDFADYLAAKGHIAEFQQKTDTVIYFRDSAEAQQIAAKSSGTKIPYPAEQLVEQAKFQELLDTLTVPGAHNREDAAAALAAVAAFYDVTLDELVRTHFRKLRTGLAAFKGLPHHIELVRKLHGVAYYDDSFSTAEPALEVAIKAFPDQPLVLIAGGEDKGVDLTAIKHLIFEAPNLRQVFLLGEIAEQLAAGEDPTKYTRVTSLAEAVTRAQKVAEQAAAEQPSTKQGITKQGITKQGIAKQKIVRHKGAEQTKNAVVLLSPGAASHDMFADYYARGDEFQKLVKNLR